MVVSEMTRLRRELQNMRRMYLELLRRFDSAQAENHRRFTTINGENIQRDGRINSNQKKLELVRTRLNENATKITSKGNEMSRNMHKISMINSRFQDAQHKVRMHRLMRMKYHTKIWETIRDLQKQVRKLQKKLDKSEKEKSEKDKSEKEKSEKEKSEKEKKDDDDEEEDSDEEGPSDDDDDDEDEDEEGGRKNPEKVLMDIQELEEKKKEMEKVIGKHLHGLTGEGEDFMVSDEELDKDMKKDKKNSLNTWRMHNKGAGFVIHLKVMKVTSMDIHLHQTNTVGDLKERVFMATGVHPDMQRLLFKDKELTDDWEAMCDIGIGRNSEVQMWIKLRGG